MSAAPTRQQFLRLYRDYLNTAQSFVSMMMKKRRVCWVRMYDG